MVLIGGIGNCVAKAVNLHDGSDGGIFHRHYSLVALVSVTGPDIEFIEIVDGDRKVLVGERTRRSRSLEQK
jgi:hypothetical protein